MGPLKTMFEFHTLNNFFTMFPGFTIEANNDLIPGNVNKLLYFNKCQYYSLFGENCEIRLLLFYFIHLN